MLQHESIEALVKAFKILSFFINHMKIFFVNPEKVKEIQIRANQ
jgi:hypothetical protein